MGVGVDVVMPGLYVVTLRGEGLVTQLNSIKDSASSVYLDIGINVYVIGNHV